MLKKDYLIRQLEEFGKVLAVLMNLKKENDWINLTRKFTTPRKNLLRLKLIMWKALDPANLRKRS